MSREESRMDARIDPRCGDVWSLAGGMLLLVDCIDETAIGVVTDRS
jgi:hypothetical protein